MSQKKVFTRVLSLGCVFLTGLGQFLHAGQVKDWLADQMIREPKRMIAERQYVRQLLPNKTSPWLLDVQFRQMIASGQIKSADEQNIGLTYVWSSANQRFKSHGSFDTRQDNHLGLIQNHHQWHTHWSLESAGYSAALNTYHPTSGKRDTHQLVLNSNGQWTKKVNVAMPGFDCQLAWTYPNQFGLGLMAQYRYFSHPGITPVKGFTGQVSMQHQYGVNTALTWTPSNQQQNQRAQLSISYNLGHSVKRKRSQDLSPVIRDPDIVVGSYDAEPSLVDFSKAVLVMGNAPSNDKLGDVIDKFGRVIRMNGFQIEGYEDQVGSKTTDVWLNDSHFYDFEHKTKVDSTKLAELVKKLKGLNVESVMVSIHDNSWFNDSRDLIQTYVHSLQESMDDFKLLWVSDGGNPNKLSLVFDHVYASNLMKQLPDANFFKPSVSLTTGFQAITHLLEQSDSSIYIQGFNNYRQGDHYYPDGRTVWTNAHQNGAEFIELLSWVKQGRIKFIGCEQSKLYGYDRWYPNDANHLCQQA